METNAKKFGMALREEARHKLRGALGHFAESLKSFKAFTDTALTDWHDEGPDTHEEGPALFMLQQALVEDFGAFLKNLRYFRESPADLPELIADCEEALQTLDADAGNTRDFRTYALALHLRTKRQEIEQGT